MKNVFIDLGSHFGAILRKFVASKSYSPDFELHAFEPNPKINSAQFITYLSGTTVHREAAWVENGEIDFYLNAARPAVVQGSSILKQKTTGDLDTAHPVKIKTIDFSAWLKKNYSIEDNVIIKCNIEGAEYPLFEKIMADGNMPIVKTLILKRHAKKIGMPEEIEAAFMKKLESISNLKLTNSYEF